MRTMSKHSKYGMEIDRSEMNKNSVKSDFEKSLPIDGKNQIKNGGESVDHVWEGTGSLCVVNSRGAIRLD